VLTIAQQSQNRARKKNIGSAAGGDAVLEHNDPPAGGELTT